MVQSLSFAILKSQARAAQAITHEQLALYYGIGRYVSQNSRSGFWGTGAIKAISEQLTYELPGLKGFSETMIKRMRTFYEEWQDLEVKSVIGMTEKGDKEHDNANSVIPMTEIERIPDCNKINQLKIPSKMFGGMRLFL